MSTPAFSDIDVRVVGHPAAAAALGELRDARTPQNVFRAYAERLGFMLAVVAVEALPTRRLEVETPVGPAEALAPDVEVVAVPVLRAGLGLLPGVSDVLPGIRVGMIGLERNEQTLEPTQYYRKVPHLEGKWVLLLEPMLATGGSASAAAQALRAEGAAGVSVLAVVATEQGIRRIAGENPGTRFVVASVDAGLNEHGYIVPGLGDFGDRLFGTTAE